MYSFEGDFRRRPQQNLSGASQHDGRLALLERAHQERQRREECRRRLSSAIIIQAFIRSYLCRQRYKQIQRMKFDEAICASKVLSLQELNVLIRRLVFFYDEQQDLNRLIFLSQLLIKSQNIFIKEASSDALCAYRLRKLLCFCMKQLHGDSGVQAMPLRMLEVFTEIPKACDITPAETRQLQTKIFRYLIKQGYYSYMCKLLEARTPPLQESSPIPPTPHCAAVLTLITRPLPLVTEEHSELNELIIGTLCEEVLAVEHSEPIQLFLIPALSQTPQLPFAQIISNLQQNWTLPKSSWMLFSLLSLEPNDFNISLNTELTTAYMDSLSKLSENIQKKKRETSLPSDTAGSDDDDSDMDIDENEHTLKISAGESAVLAQCCEYLNEDNRVKRLLQVGESSKDPRDLQALCILCHQLLLSHKFAVHKYKLLYTLAFKPSFLCRLWEHVSSLRQNAPWAGPRAPLLSLVARGIALCPSDSATIIPILAVFCSLFSLLISTLDDGEFCGDSIPFTLSELVPIITILKDVCLGLVDLAFPESRAMITHDYQLAMGSQPTLLGQDTTIWAHLFKVTVHLLQQLYTRDLRRGFCPPDHWVAPHVRIPNEKPADYHMRRGLYKPFRGVRFLTREELEEGPPLTVKEVRWVTILRELPFVVSFETRVQVFQVLLQNERLKQHGDLQAFLRGPAINISLRRSHLYEDAFEKLSLENEPNLRLKTRVQLVNTAGLEEAGVDGGGIFREVLSELLHSAFDPNRGFFRMAEDHSLYPNPGVGVVVEDYQMHYFFIGRILGKALFENLLVELPLAEFFLCKLVGTGVVDAHHLSSLDPTLHRTLLSLKSYPGDVVDLGLDFTVMSEELGETRIDELKPDGSNIPVTSSNRIEYIHLMADHKLNKQIRTQCIAFRRGMGNVIPLNWLSMFSYKELQILISGSENPVDVDDLRRNTCYTGGYTEDHPTIQMFWRAIAKFDDIQKRQLLKFVTSCSRPPLLGFKELEPPFCIQLAGSSDRLPTASTCINLLKLPEFPDENVLFDRLLYAIQSGAGFELS